MNVLTYPSYCQLVLTLDSLTDSEVRLNNYIHQHFNGLAYYVIVELANNSNVSKATIGRFLNKIGFTGYSAFKNAIKLALSERQIEAPIEIHQKQAHENGNTNDHIHQFSDQISGLLQQFIQNSNIKDIEQLIDLILDDSRNFYIVGPSSSASMALHFATLIKYIRKNVTLLNLDVGELPKNLIHVKEDDVVVIFSYYRFNKVAIDIAHWFKKKEGDVVLISNSKSNPYGKYCDLQFILPSHINSIFQSRCMGFIFVELLLHLSYKKTENEGNFKVLEELFTFFDTFASAPQHK